MRRGLATGLAVVGLLAMGACGGEKKHAGPEVEVKEISFRPTRISVRVGAEVAWAFEDKTAHNVTSDDGSFRSENLTEGVFLHRFEKPGSFTYMCTIHPDRMKGTVDVRG